MARHGLAGEKIHDRWSLFACVAELPGNARPRLRPRQQVKIAYPSGGRPHASHPAAPRACYRENRRVDTERSFQMANPSSVRSTAISLALHAAAIALLLLLVPSRSVPTPRSAPLAEAIAIA